MTHKDYINECRAKFHNFFVNNRCLIRYIRKGPGKPPIGVVVAFKDKNDGLPTVGASLCNKKDRWNKYIGLMKAIESAEKDTWDNLPYTLLPHAEDMYYRAERYFSNSKPEKTPNFLVDLFKGLISKQS